MPLACPTKKAASFRQRLEGKTDLTTPSYMEDNMADNDNTPSSSEMLRRRFGRSVAFHEPTLLDLGRKFEVAWAEEREAWEAYGADRSFKIDGCNPLWLRADMLQGRTHRIILEIRKRKATTLEELRVKARAVLWAHFGQLDIDVSVDPVMSGSILEDILTA